MKRILLSAALVLLSMMACRAQSFTFGPKVGVNFANLSINDVGGYAIQNPMRVGFVFGGFACYNFGGMLSAQVELVYSSQGSKLRDDNGNKGTIKLDYINIPMLAKFNIIGNLSVNAGLQVGFLVRKKFKDDVRELGRAMTFHTADLAIPLGVSYDFPNNLTLDLRYDVGLVNAVKSGSLGSLKSKNGVLQLSGAWRF